MLGRRVVADARVDGETKRVARLTMLVPKRGDAQAIALKVNREYRGQKISHELTEHAKKLVGRMGKKLVRKK